MTRRWMTRRWIGGGEYLTCWGMPAYQAAAAHELGGRAERLVVGGANLPGTEVALVASMPKGVLHAAVRREHVGSITRLAHHYADVGRAHRSAQTPTGAWAVLPAHLEVQGREQLAGGHRAQERLAVLSAVPPPAF